MRKGMETVGVPPPGYKPYPGGHFRSYHIKAGQSATYGIAPHKEGIIVMTIDSHRARAYGLTWPTGHFAYYE